MKLKSSRWTQSSPRTGGALCADQKYSAPRGCQYSSLRWPKNHFRARFRLDSYQGIASAKLKPRVFDLPLRRSLAQSTGTLHPRCTILPLPVPPLRISVLFEVLYMGESPDGPVSLRYRCECGSEIAFRSRRRSVFERIFLPLLLMQPVRCGECFRRDYRSIFTPVHERLSDTLRIMPKPSAASKRNVA